MVGKKAESKNDLLSVVRMLIPYLSLLAGGGAVVNSEYNKSDGGNLNNFINNDYRSFKEWVSIEFREKGKNIEKNTEYRLRAEGVASVTTNTNNQFTDEYHKGVLFKRNMLTNQLFYEVSGSRIKVHFSESKGL